MTAAPAARPPASPPAAPMHPLLQLLRLARPLRGQLVLAVLAGALSTGCAVALLGTSRFLLARASLHPSILAISVAVVAVRGLSVGRGVFRYVERLASHDAAFRVLADVRVRVYRQLARLAPAGLRDFRSGDLLARLVSDVDATQDLFIRGLAPPLTAALVGAGAAAAVALILAPAGLVLAAGLLVAGLAVSWLAAARAGQAARRTAPARGELTARVTDLLAGSADLHAAGAQDAALAAADAADHELTRLARRSAAGAALGSGLSQAVAGLTLWGVLLLGVAAVGGGTLTRVPLAVLTLTALASFEAVTALPAAAIQLGQARASAARVAAVLDAPDPVAEPVTPRPLPAGPLRVSLRGARVRYQPDGPLAIDGVDLDLAAGRRVALLGPSGSGKSTVAAVLLRFIDLTGGTCILGGTGTLGGADLASYAPAEVRTVISGCTEDPHLFDTTIADNIRLARPGAGQPDLDEVATRARLLTWIRSLPRGWDTMVGPGGIAVSGGERQRIALARALLADPPLLILDEPAAHLDPGNRRALTADLLAATAGRATLLITHDLDGLDQVDEIVVLAGGRVVERGRHQELCQAGGLYQRMHEAGRS
jgi:ATP-binding cassette, subfamily C, bacterial CydC